MLPNATELTYFIEVAHTLNMSRAAERLGITQPALTLAIQRLEYALGQKVLIRSKTGVKLTKSGEKLALRTKALLSEWEKIKSETAKDEQEVRGRYIIGCHPSVTLYTAPYYLPTLLEKNSNLEIKFVHDLSRKITEAVISFKVDFGIVVNPVSHPDLIIKELMTDEVSFWIGSQKSTLQDVKSGKAVLICDPDLLQSQSLMTHMEKFGLKFSRNITSSNLEVITALVASGAGVGILPGRVATHIKSYKLKPLKMKCPKFSDRICLIYRVDTQKSLASKALIQEISNSLLF